MRTHPAIPNPSMAGPNADSSVTRSGRGLWRGLEDPSPNAVELRHGEFPPGASEWPAGLDRREFLQWIGATLALAGATGCTRQPIERIVPYVRQPEQLVLGKPLYFATAMTLGGYGTGLVVESHEGHPTKIEGNPDHPMSLGATNVFHQGSLLDLYDPDRSKSILCQGEISTWPAFRSAVQPAVAALRARGGAGLRILTGRVTSPTLAGQLSAVLKLFPEAQWHVYEPVLRDSVLDGARLAFGEIVETFWDLRQAAVVLSLDCDFLGHHPAALRHARDFIDGRRLSSGRQEMNRLYVVESTPTVTGSTADHRLPLASSRIGHLLLLLAQGLGVPGFELPAVEDGGFTVWLAAVVDDLKKHPGRSLVMVGETQPAWMHAVAQVVNERLGNFGRSVWHAAPAEANPVPHLESLQRLTSDLAAGAVDLLAILGGNPAFTAPADLDFGRHLLRARQRIHLSHDLNETSILCDWHIPENSYLESWSDVRAFDGTTSIVQPLILPLYEGRSAHEVLACIEGRPEMEDYEIVREYWRSAGKWKDFERGWREVLHDGVIPETSLPKRRVTLRQVVRPEDSTSGVSPRETEVCFRPDAATWDGRFANNGWLQELPRPVTRLTWDNAALVSPALARREGLKSGDIVELTGARSVLRIPVWVTPGQADASIALHLGYGREKVGRVGSGAGVRVEVLRESAHPWWIAGVKVRKTEGRRELVTVQTQQVIDSDERQVYREGTLDEYVRDPEFVKKATESPPEEKTLFRRPDMPGGEYRWAMSIDLTACIGCGACVIACQAENNIPVVGRHQVAMGRHMQWIRVDTYFRGSPDAPVVNQQPVPCMQCEKAPCELVCPVGATLHDSEGLNVQVYNRCIGTRYCSNNCPYKVRRFNFLQFADYHTASLKPMRNPNVTVRWRGVMEKCTYCVQRISAARIRAKEEGRRIRDGEVVTACQQVCPTQAIVFGDLSDPESRVHRLKNLPLDFPMLGQLNTRPRTTYLARVRNPRPDLPEGGPVPASASEGGSHA